MLRLVGVVTNHGSFTPNPSNDNPHPQTYFSLEIEGVSIGLPPGYNRSLLPPVGTEATVTVVPQRGQNGLKFRLVPASVPAR